VWAIATAISADVVGGILGCNLHPNFRLFWGWFTYAWKVPTSFDMCVQLSADISSAPTGWIFVKFYIWDFCENMLRKSKFGYNWIKIFSTLCADPCTFCCSWWHKITRETLFKSIYSAAMQKECIFTFPWQHFHFWLHYYVSCFVRKISYLIENTVCVHQKEQQ
jgi:hypothetical protein